MAFPVYIKSSKKRISISKEIREVNRLRLRFDLGMARKLNSLFSKTARTAAEAYRNNGNPILAIEDLDLEMRAVFKAQYTVVIDTFAERVYDGRKQSIFIDLIDMYYLLYGALRVRNVSNYTRSLILKAIRIGEADGLGVDETAKLIIEKTAGAVGRSRAATIARTETNGAASYATDTASRSLNLPNQKKRWVSVGDSRTRPSHSAANGQEVLIDEPFILRDSGAEIRMKFPHDGSGGAKNNVNCRCLAIYFTEEDDLFDDMV